MATIDDVSLTGQAYQDLYAATGITPSTAVVVQNKTHAHILLQNVAAQPAASSQAGFALEPFEAIDVTGVIYGLWAMGTGPVMVEAMNP